MHTTNYCHIIYRDIKDTNAELHSLFMHDIAVLIWPVELVIVHIAINHCPCLLTGLFVQKALRSVE